MVAGQVKVMRSKLNQVKLGQSKDLSRSSQVRQVKVNQVYVTASQEKTTTNGTI